MRIAAAEPHPCDHAPATSNRPMQNRKEWFDLPIARRPELMQILATLLAEVFVGTRFFGHDPNTTAVLPDLANVALYKQASGIVRNISREKGVEPEGMLKAMLRVFVEWRRPLVLVVPADAAHGLVLVLVIAVAVRHCGCFRFVSCSFSLFNLSSGPPAGPEGVLGRYCVFWGF